MNYSNEMLHQVLHCPMDDNDARATTIGGYLGSLLVELWRANEGFSGKRPFGNSGWQWDVYKALVKNGLAEGTVFDDDGYEELEDFTYEAEQAADELIIQAIQFAYNHEG